MASSTAGRSDPGDVNQQLSAAITAKLIEKEKEVVAWREQCDGLRSKLHAQSVHHSRWVGYQQPVNCPLQQ